MYGARLRQHARGEVSSTRFRRPWQLIYYEACREAADAYRRERYLKTGRGKRYLRQRLKTWRMHLASDGSECPILGLPLLPEYSQRPEKSWDGTRFSFEACRPLTPSDARPTVLHHARAYRNPRMSAPAWITPVAGSYSTIVGAVGLLQSLPTTSLCPRARSPFSTASSNRFSTSRVNG